MLAVRSRSVCFEIHRINYIYLWKSKEVLSRFSNSTNIIVFSAQRRTNCIIDINFINILCLISSSRKLLEMKRKALQETACTQLKKFRRFKVVTNQVVSIVLRLHSTYTDIGWTFRCGRMTRCNLKGLFSYSITIQHVHIKQRDTVAIKAFS